ncbi:unnamed protein product [Blepharisma stoltei]|uniref:Secreted protein n=1 Tax=Blepharisma stoltei TaxID=1481888 RepID=A0AAU9JS88_9CILI|nr:unnamed protein product [Blepharisma stoltei]
MCESCQLLLQNLYILVAICFSSEAFPLAGFSNSIIQTFFSSDIWSKIPVFVSKYLMKKNFNQMTKEITISVPFAG